MTRPATLLGFTPFADLIPLAGGHAAQFARRLNHLATFLSDRAHMSFVPAGPPRLIFVGVTGRRLDRDRKGGRSRTSWRRLLGFTPVCGPVPPAHVWPADRSCLGLGLLQGCRTRFRAPRAGSTPIVIISLRRPTPDALQCATARALQSAHGFSASFPNSDATNARMALGQRHIPVLAPGRMLPTRAMSPLPSAY